MTAVAEGVDLARGAGDDQQAAAWERELAPTVKK